MFTMDGKESMGLQLLSLLDVKKQLYLKAATLLTFGTNLHKNEKKLNSGVLVGKEKEILAT